MTTTSSIDPGCTICGKSDLEACGCEGLALDQAMLQAEEVVMKQVYKDLRDWVREKAREYIVAQFQILSEPRKAAHAHELNQLNTQFAYHFNTVPLPTRIARVNEHYRRSITTDWAACVEKYPEVVQYYFGLVQVNLPRDDAVAVSNPPLGMLNEIKARNRQRWDDASIASAAGAAAAAGGGIHGHGHPSYYQRPHGPGPSRFNGRGAPMAFFRPPGF